MNDSKSSHEYEAADCSYGTSAPKKTKNSHTGWIVAACLFVIAASSLHIGTTLLGLRLGHDARRTAWNDTQTEPSDAAATDDSVMVVPVYGIDPCSTPALALSTGERAGMSAAECRAQLSPSLVQLTVLFSDRSVDCTGVLFTSDGYLLAGCGDLREAIEIGVRTDDGGSCRATWIGTDPETGLALLKLLIRNHDFQPAVFVSTEEAAVGDRVLTVDANGNWAEGKLSAVGDAEIKSSSALTQNGAALVDGSGAVIGISLAESADGQIGTDAVSSDALPAVVERILAANPAAQLWLDGDVAEIPALFIQYYRYPGTLWFRDTYISSGPQSHDIILAADGKPVATWEEMNSAVAAHSPGETMELTVYRDGKTFTVLLPVQGR